MTATVSRTGRLLPPPLRRPKEYGLVLLVAASAVQTVSDRLNGAVDVQKLDDGPLGDVPRYRVDVRPGAVANVNAVKVPAAESDTRPSVACPLSARELQVLNQAALGKQNQEIGSDLHISTETVRTHMRNIFRRIGARDRAHAVHIGHENGFLSRSEDAA